MSQILTSRDWNANGDSGSRVVSRALSPGEVDGGSGAETINSLESGREFESGDFLPKLDAELSLHVVRVVLHPTLDIVQDIHTSATTKVNRSYVVSAKEAEEVVPLVTCALAVRRQTLQKFARIIAQAQSKWRIQEQTEENVRLLDNAKAVCFLIQRLAAGQIALEPSKHSQIIH
jgi:hypothetical protein